VQETDHHIAFLFGIQPLPRVRRRKILCLRHWSSLEHSVKRFLGFCKRFIRHGGRPFLHPNGDLQVRLLGDLHDRRVQRPLAKVRPDRQRSLLDEISACVVTVTIAECNSPPLQEGARIRQISEDQTKLLFECEDDSTLDLTIVDPGNSVILRDKNNQVEYLG
jgi:hypothetical protein